MEDKKIGEFWQENEAWITRWGDGPVVGMWPWQVRELIRKLVEERQARYNITLARTLEHFGIPEDQWKS